MRNTVLFVICFLAVSRAYSQDYARKPYASIHYYAESILGSQIVSDKEDVNVRSGKLYYYKELDLNGSYVHVSGGYMGDYYLSMWKMENGNDLIGVTHFNCQPFCVYECSFFEYSKDDSTEVSKDILPVGKMVKHMNKIAAKVKSIKPDVSEDNPQFKFILPHDQGVLGLYISMNKNQIEFPIMDLKWTGTKFSIVTKYKEIPAL
ncbi:hypothetical protein K6119_05130 [Paracrocinitomix mangrovi]|uniref:hypothetical protein n=1 Tax=Paracrocinitomix mangrovi TaxID=2862509 RepID=UPI001C8D57AC|nr:hypothetical protein [Paracrocinitomix mangrovi]UKN02896.1 hypothetical protein K6119_05130 [Paracrocinitomix mangrovi]